MEKLLIELMEKNRHLTRYGKVADYIPALAKASSNDIGVCIIDMDGNICGSGDYKKKFTIQSISKIITLLLALVDRGTKEVFSKVGMKPTTESFNSLYKMDLFSGSKPSNPMMNSGAIVTTSLIEGNGKEKFNRILDITRKITSNNKLNYNEEVYLSEKKTADKNRAIAYLLKNMKVLDGDVEEILDTYFKQCSIEVDCADLAKIGLFFANKCKSPSIIESNNEDIATLITTIMSTCGMYDFSGEYAVKVGVPSKSGVSGGILATVPGRFGIGIYGPSLDRYGNSIVGCEIMKDLSKELNLNIFR